jgi:hypothetical protein
MSEKLDATLSLMAGVMTALSAAKELQKHDQRAKQVLTMLQRLKTKTLPIISEEYEKLKKEEEEFIKESDSKVDWIEGRR